MFEKQEARHSQAVSSRIREAMVRPQLAFIGCVGLFYAWPSASRMAIIAVKVWSFLSDMAILDGKPNV